MCGGGRIAMLNDGIAEAQANVVIRPVEGLVDVGHASIDIRGGGSCRQCSNQSDDRPSTAECRCGDGRIASPLPSSQPCTTTTTTYPLSRPPRGSSMRIDMEVVSGGGGGSGGSGNVPSMSMLTSFHSSSFARSTLFLAINDRCYDPGTLTIGAFSKSRRMLVDDDKDNRGGAKAGAG